MQTRTVVSQATCFPHGLGISISLNIEDGDTVLSSEPLTLFTISRDGPLADQLAGLNGLINTRGWPDLTPDQMLRIGALREIATATDADLASLAGAAAVAAVAENAALAGDRAQLKADLDALKTRLDVVQDAG